TIRDVTCMRSPSRKQQAALFQPLFAGLPKEDPSRRLDGLAEVNHSFRQALADELRPVVRTLLQKDPPSDGNAKKELARRLNRILSDAGLSIVDPGSGEPAIVVAESYRLRLQTRQAPQTCSSNTTKLPPLDLVEYVRQEPLRTWRK